MNEAILTCHDFGVAYGGKPVLSHVDTAILPHRITAIMGPSGSGKSTLLKAMNRMLELENGAELSGSIHFCGKDIQSLPAEELRRRVGMVFQSPAPFPMSIYKNLTYAPLYFGSRDRKSLDQLVREVLETTGLYDEVKDDLRRSALTLSGGQQQDLRPGGEGPGDTEPLLLAAGEGERAAPEIIFHLVIKTGGLQHLTYQLIQRLSVA